VEVTAMMCEDRPTRIQHILLIARRPHHQTASHVMPPLEFKAVIVKDGIAT